MTEHAEGTIFASHHVYYLREARMAELPREQPDRSNGLVSAHPGIALVFTGVHTGEVIVHAEVLEGPPAIQVAAWEEVVEVSMQAPYGEMRLTGLFTETDSEHRYPLLTQHGPGDYRFRIHARGRDAADSFVTESDAWEYGELPEDAPPPEEYLIMVWPAPQAPTFIHKQTDSYGARQRRSAAQSTG
ncbi:hypothetical protein [Actinomadura sp. 21ATH]|uniref:hypothetical protein n=1 Tax=Actinomadura sp. 21ATH TaxID=1735444 RepID=UPI0035BF8691